VWNQVFAGDPGAPAQCFPAQSGCGGNPYTTLATTPISREKPYLFVDGGGAYRVFVPAPRRDSTGDSWSGGPTPGRSIPLSDFFIATPSDSVQEINNALAMGRNLLLTPGVYDVDQTIKVKRADTVMLGLGLATLTAVDGAVPLTVADVPGVDIAGLIVDAGATSSPCLLRVGTTQATGLAPRPADRARSRSLRRRGPDGIGRLGAVDGCCGQWAAAADPLRAVLVGPLLNHRRERLDRRGT
jgi:hypothetical protein